MKPPRYTYHESWCEHLWMPWEDGGLEHVGKGRVKRVWERECRLCELQVFWYSSPSLIDPAGCPQLRVAANAYPLGCAPI